MRSSRCGCRHSPRKPRVIWSALGEASRQDLMRARHRVSKLLLRHAIVYSGGKAWTELHDRWLRQQRFDSRSTQAAFDDAYETVVLAAGRRSRLDEKIIVLAAGQRVHPAGAAAGVSAWHRDADGFALAVEIGDRQRFSGASIGAYLGLVPSEHSSGQSRSQGGITKTGNAHLRRLLVEAAWHHRSTYRPGVVLRPRWDQAPAAARGLAGTPATNGCTPVGSI